MTNFAKWRADFSLSAFVAGFIIVLVGMTSAAVLVFEAARAAGANPSEAGSWLGSMCIGIGLYCLIFSLKYRVPVLGAWSTAGAAILITGSAGFTMGEIIGAFVACCALTIAAGASGLFERVMNRIPVALASALLGGVLLHFTLSAFSSFTARPVLIGTMFAVFVAARRWQPRFAMLFVLLAGMAVAAATGLLHFENFRVEPTAFEFVPPAFSLKALLSLGLPLFIVTMASQNLTGITAIRAHGFRPPVSPLITWSGVFNLLVAPFGGFSVNIAAITASIGLSAECHPQPDKRYISGAVSGVMYILVGFFAGTVTALFGAFPKELIMGIAGFALLGTVSGSLKQALSDEPSREAAFITFAIAASGLSLFGVGAAFWAILTGVAVQFVFSRGQIPRS